MIQIETGIGRVRQRSGEGQTESEKGHNKTESKEEERVGQAAPIPQMEKRSPRKSDGFKARWPRGGGIHVIIPQKEKALEAWWRNGSGLGIYISYIK